MSAPVGTPVGVQDVATDYGAGHASLYQHGVVTPDKDTTGATLLVVAVTANGYNYSGFIGLPVGVNDNMGNTFLPIGYQLEEYSISNVQFWYCYAPTVGAGHHVWASKEATDKFSVIFSAWSGTKQTADVVRTANGSETYETNTGTLATGYVTPKTNDLVLAAVASGSQSSDPAGPAIDSGFTVGAFYAEAVNGHDLALAYLVAPNGNPINPTWTWDVDPVFEPLAQTLVASIIVFRDAADTGDVIQIEDRLRVVQSTGAGLDGQGRGYNVSYDFPILFQQDTVRGNAVVVGYVVTESDGYDPVIYDSQGNTYTLLQKNDSVPQQWSGAWFRSYVWLAENIRGGPLTVSTNHAHDPATVYPVMAIFEVAGLPLSGALDQAAENYQAGTLDPTTASITLAQADEILFALLVHDVSPGPSLVPDATWSEVADDWPWDNSNENNVGYCMFECCCKIVDSTGPQALTWATLSGAVNVGTIIVALKAAPTTKNIVAVQQTSLFSDLVQTAEVAFPSNVTEGRDVLLLGTMDGTLETLDQSVLSDSQGNAYVYDKVSASAIPKFVARTKASSSGPLTVTFTMPTSQSINILSVEASNLQLGPLDKTAIGSGENMAPQPPAVTLSQAHELLVGVMEVDGNPTITPPTGWTTLGLQGKAGKYVSFAGAYRIVTAGGTHQPAWTMSASGPWSAIVATYRMNDLPDPVDVFRNGMDVTRGRRVS